MSEGVPEVVGACVAVIVGVCPVVTDCVGVALLVGVREPLCEEVALGD